MPNFSGGGSSPPKAPPFNPITIGGNNGIAQKALDQDLARYFSYQFLFPGMTQMRQSEINDAYKQLTGPLSPDFQQEFLRNASTTNAAVTGGGNLYSGAGQVDNSFNKGSESASVTRQTMAKQDYDRARMESLIQQNPIPGLGLSQGDLLSLFVYNTGAANASAMQNFAQGINNANLQNSMFQNNLNSIANLVGGLGNIYSNYQNYNNAGSGGVPYGGDFSGLGFNFDNLGL